MHFRVMRWVVLTFLCCLLGCACGYEPVFAFSLTLNASESITTDVVPGVDGTGITVAADEVNVISDCQAGYYFSMVGPSDSNLYLGGDSDSEKYFSPVDGESALNSLVNANKWGYSLTENSLSGVFSALSSESQVLKTPTQTASQDDIDDSISVYYGMAINASMVPGSYTFSDNGRIRYQAVMDVSCIPGIHYIGNGEDEGTMDVQEVEAGASVYLIPSNYSKEGYGFASWNTEPDGTGTNYGPNERITMPSSGVLVLYANWVESSGNLQGWTGCSSLEMYDVIGLTDIRDGNVYAVAKLADGKCWMVENLRLDLATVDINVLNTSNPKDEFLEKLSTVTSSDGSGTWCNQTLPDAQFSSDPCVNSIQYNINNLDRSLDASYNINDTRDVSWYSYGAMYNFYSARAGGSRYNGESSICPKGWRLPTGQTRNSGDYTQDYHALMYAWDNNYQAASLYSDNGVEARLGLAYPNNFVLSGTFVDHRTGNGTAFYGRGVISPIDETAYWGVGNYGSSGGNSFDFNGQYGVFQVGNTLDTRGAAVRCIIENNLETFSLNYDMNGSETVIPTVTVDANKVYSFTISSVVPQRNGYSFKWWIDKNGNKYNPGDTFTTIDVDSTLYAIWENNDCNHGAETINQAVCLQDLNDSVRATMVSKQTYTLKDSRDNRQYTISLLDDGEVWMTKNLNVGRDTRMVLLPNDTDITDEYLVLPAQTNTFTTDKKTIQLKIDNQNGGYYSWPAAIMSNASYGTINSIISTSICPFGWDLPLDTHYSSLITAAGISNFQSAMASPYNFTRSGYFSGSNLNGAGTRGYYWTAVTTNYSAQRTNYSRIASLENSFTIPNYGISRNVGSSVRCIASNGSGTINYNANGGSGEMSSQSNVELNATEIAENDFVEPNEHKLFREWNTRADGSGIAIKVGEPASKIKSNLVNGAVTLYAQWDDAYIVTFNNTADGRSETKKVVVGQRVSSSSAMSWDYDREYYELIGWDTNSSGQNVVYQGRDGGFSPTSDLTLYTVWSPLYLVSYDGNGADSGNMDSYSTNLLRPGSNVILLGNDFIKAGYGFVGWSMNSLATPGDGVSTIYGPEDVFVIPGSAPAGSLVLYAIWVEADSNYTLQSFAENLVCDNMSIGDIVALEDARDLNTYAVAKLADGKCWMIEDMRLDPTQTTINDQNTDGPTSDFVNALSGYPSLYDGCNDSSDPDCVDSVGFGDNDIFSRGKGYNWYTATAGNGTYDDTSWKAIGSICPSGWHLPRGSYWGEGEEGELDALRDAIGGYSDWAGRSYPNNFSDSYYWLSSTNDFSDTVSFYGHDGSINDYSFNKTNYLSMRCVADVEYTVEFTSNYYSGGNNSIGNLSLGDTFVLPNNGFTYDEWEMFIGWSFEEYYTGDYSESSVIYPAGSSITIDRALRDKISADGVISIYPVFDHDPNY